MEVSIFVLWLRMEGGRSLEQSAEFCGEVCRYVFSSPTCLMLVPLSIVVVMNEGDSSVPRALFINECMCVV